jgi:hypothetical protein
MNILGFAKANSALYLIRPNSILFQCFGEQHVEGTKRKKELQFMKRNLDEELSEKERMKTLGVILESMFSSLVEARSV